MWGCVLSVYPFPLWWLREYIYFVLLSSSNRKYVLWTITHCLRLGHETMVCGVCLSIFKCHAYNVYNQMVISYIAIPNFLLATTMAAHDDVIKKKHFRVTGPLCGEFIGHWWIPLTRASDAVLWCFLWSAKRLSKQSWGWWFETPSRSLWRHCNVFG